MAFEAENPFDSGDEQAEHSEFEETVDDMDSDVGVLENLIGGRRGDVLRVLHKPRGKMSGAKGKDQMFRSTKRR